MLRGTGATSSSIHAAGAPGPGERARPNALVVLVKTKPPAPAATASSSRLSVPVMLVSTKSCRVCDPTCGLWSVAAWMTASTPAMPRRSGRIHQGPPRGLGFHTVDLDDLVPRGRAAHDRHAARRDTKPLGEQLP